MRACGVVAAPTARRKGRTGVRSSRQNIERRRYWEKLHAEVAKHAGATRHAKKKAAGRASHQTPHLQHMTYRRKQAAKPRASNVSACMQALAKMNRGGR
jgi:hypothetical protein